MSSQIEIQIAPLSSLGTSPYPWSKGYGHARFDDMPPTAPGYLELAPIRLFSIEEVTAGEGFAMHTHTNIEVITMIRSGAFIHRDSVGDHGRIEVDDVQVMSAGDGIEHEEIAAEGENTRAVQIWLDPISKGGAPHSETRNFPRVQRRGHLICLVSGSPDSIGSPLTIQQDAQLLAVDFLAGDTESYAVEHGRCAYLVALDSDIDVNGKTVRCGERIIARGDGKIALKALGHTEVLLLDLPCP